MVSWADRIAYVCHDFEDAVAAGVVTPDMLPAVVRERCGAHPAGARSARSSRSMAAATEATGRIGMRPAEAEALAALRQFDYEHIYLRPASVHQAEAVIRLLQALVERYADRPNLLPSERRRGWRRAARRPCARPSPT